MSCRQMTHDRNQFSKQRIKACQWHWVSFGRNAFQERPAWLRVFPAVMMTTESGMTSISGNHYVQKGRRDCFSNFLFASQVVPITFLSEKWLSTQSHTHTDQCHYIVSLEALIVFPRHPSWQTWHLFLLTVFLLSWSFLEIYISGRLRNVTQTESDKLLSRSCSHFVPSMMIIPFFLKRKLLSSSWLLLVKGTRVGSLCQESQLKLTGNETRRTMLLHLRDDSLRWR